MKRSRIELEWVGPFNLPNIENAPPKISGVYIWTIGSQEELFLSYVGETDNLKKRFRDHIISQLGGAYTLYDPDELHKGRLELVYQPLTNSEPFYRDFLPDIPNKLRIARRNLEAYVLFWAELNEKRLIRQAVESALINHAKNSNFEIQNSRRSCTPERSPPIEIMSRLPAGVSICGFNTQLTYGYT